MNAATRYFIIIVWSVLGCCLGSGWGRLAVVAAEVSPAAGMAAQPAQTTGAIEERVQNLVTGR